MRANRLLGLLAGVCAFTPGLTAAGADERSIAVAATWTERHPDTLSATVSYADLDLRTEQGRRTLSRRVYDVADRLCWRVVTTRFLDDQITCRGAAVDGARDQVRQAERAALSTP